ncbi:unnamed protein product [Durusdinium trenchii]|uniref:Uncharacterized protein n=1 Tax=Durusdinium trenchii TaxID=1381693 RepID=A0ABP0P0Y4_9DINO
MEGQLMSLILRLERQYNMTGGEVLLLTPSPLTLWQMQPHEGCVARTAGGVGPSLPLSCNTVALGLEVELVTDEPVELQLRFPRGGSTGVHRWRGLLRANRSEPSALGESSLLLSAPVALGPWPRAAVRSGATAVAAPGRLWLDLDVGVDLCLVDPTAWVPAEVRVVPPVASDLRVLDPAVEGPGLSNAPPVDCLWQATRGSCLMTLSWAQWKRGLHCLFRGVVYTLHWEILVQAVITKSSGWELQVTYPVPLDGSLNGSTWSSSPPALPTSFGSLPFFTCQALRPVPGGERWRETLLLLRFQTGQS